MSQVKVNEDVTMEGILQGRPFKFRPQYQGEVQMYDYKVCADESTGPVFLEKRFIGRPNPEEGFWYYECNISKVTQNKIRVYDILFRKTVYNSKKFVELEYSDVPLNDTLEKTSTHLL